MGRANSISSFRAPRKGCQARRDDRPRRGFETPLRSLLRGHQAGLQSDGFAVKENLAARALFDAGDLAHKGGFPRPVVAHDRHVLALAQDEVCVFQSVDTAIVFGQAAWFPE